MTAEATANADIARRFPRIADLRPRARRRLLAFTHDFLMGGSGDELGYARNLQSFAEIGLVPRYGGDMQQVSTRVERFGREWTMPVAIAPVGMDGGIWPGATRALGRAARAAGIPYMAGTLASSTIEDVAKWNPDGTWFQLYTMPGEDHRVSFDLIARAAKAGVKVLAVTMDIPLPARRARDIRNGLSLPFRITPRVLAQAMIRPAWLAALARHGQPTFANLAAYCREGASNAEVAVFARNARAGEGAGWDTVARIRAAWPHVLLVKGILHPADALHAISLGVDGVIVSNHGGRQFDAAPAPIDVLPAVRAALGPDVPVWLDSGILSGLDVLKALALGADGVLAGRAFMLGLAALGDRGAVQVADILRDELRVALGQSGALTIAGAGEISVRHPSAWSQDMFGTPGRPQAEIQG